MLPPIFKKKEKNKHNFQITDPKDKRQLNTKSAHSPPKLRLLGHHDQSLAGTNIQVIGSKNKVRDSLCVERKRETGDVYTRETERLRPSPSATRDRKSNQELLKVLGTRLETGNRRLLFAREVTRDAGTPRKTNFG